MLFILDLKLIFHIKIPIKKIFNMSLFQEFGDNKFSIGFIFFKIEIIILIIIS